MRYANQKLKLLYLAQMFEEETDEKKGMTMPDIIQYLSDCGISAERKAIYNDIVALQEFGMDIQKRKCSPVEYALVKRDFTMAELMLLADAVQSSRFLTKSKSDKLLGAIKTLGSKRQVKSLNRHLHVEGRISAQNESVYYNVDRIQEAISAKRKVSFLYYKYDANKEQVIQHNGQRYEETPVTLIYSDDFYYVVTFNDKHEDFTHYRVDRMLEIEVSEEKATRNASIANFDPAQYENRLFGMFSGETEQVTLEVAEEAMSSVIDRFGKDVPVKAVAEGKTHVHITVMLSPVFYGWLTQFGGKVSIANPKSAQNAYIDYLRDMLANMNEGK